MPGIANAYTYPVPTVDVSLDMMIMIKNARTDITDLYCGHFKPDGVTEWCPQGVPYVRDIIVDWWTRVAGGNDAPDLYSNSLARWAEKNLGIAIPAQPGSGTIKIQTTEPAAAGSITPAQFVGFGVVILTTLVFFGRREKQLTFVPTPRVGGGSASYLRALP